MIDPSLILKIKQMRIRGLTYNAITSALHISKSTISRALNKESDMRVPGKNSTLPQTSLLFDEQPLLIKKGGTVESADQINKKESKLIADRNGLRLLSIDDPTPNLKKHSWGITPFGKFVFLCGIAGFLIWIFRRVRGYENELY